MTTQATDLQTGNLANRTGTVVAVCLREESGVPKYPQSEVIVGEYGIEGDYHAGPMRRRSDGEVVPNTRHVSLVAKEVFDDLNRELGTDIPHGGFGGEHPRRVHGRFGRHRRGRRAPLLIGRPARGDGAERSVQEPHGVPQPDTEEIVWPQRSAGRCEEHRTDPAGGYDLGRRVI